MNKRLLLFTILSLSFLNLFSFEVDSLEFNNINNQVKYLTEISNEFQENKEILENIDILNNNLMLYRAKDSFYSSSLSQQSSRFTWILTGILTAFGAITLGGVNWQIQRLKEDNNKFATNMNNEMARAKNALLIQEFNISATTADVYTVQSNVFSNTGDFGGMYYSLITVSASRVRALKIGSAIDVKLRDTMIDVPQVLDALTKNLEGINNLTTLITESKPKKYSHINTIKNNSENIRLLISEIISFVDGDLQLSASKVLVGFEEIINISNNEH